MSLALKCHNMETTHARPLVGTGVMIFKDGKVLLGKRIGSHGDGEYSFPGGHLDYLESFDDCIRRETREECGLEITNVRFEIVFNMRAYAPKHYVGLGFLADWTTGEPQLLEPHKCESWNWYALDALPSPIFECSRLMIEAYKSGETYYDV